MASAGVAYVDIFANWGPFEASTSRLPASVGTKMSSLGKSLTKYLSVPLAGIGVASADLAAKFDRSMLLIHTSAGASKKEVAALGKYIEDLGTKAPQSLNELADAAYRIEGGGIHGAKAMKALKESTDFAVLQNTNVEETAKSVTQVAFANMAGAGENFQKIVAGLNATIGAGDLRGSNLIEALGTGLPAAAKQAGLSFEGMEAALAVIGDNTTNVAGWSAQLGTAFHFLTNPTEKATSALEAIGLTGTSLAEKLKSGSLLPALRELKEHLDDLPGGVKGVQATQMIGDILPGGRGRILLTFMNELGKLKEKGEDIPATSSPGRFKKSVKEAYEQPAVKAEIAWNNLKTALTKLGKAILPAVIPIMEKIGEKISKVGTWFSHLSPHTQSWIVKIGAAVIALGPVLVIAGKIHSIFGKIYGTIGKIISRLAKVVMPKLGGGSPAEQTEKLGERGATPENPVWVREVGPGRGGEPIPGGGGAPTPAEDVPGWGRWKTIGATGVLTAGLAGLAEAGSPGVADNPINKLKGIAHGGDPTRLLELLGLPSATGLLGVTPTRHMVPKTASVLDRYLRTGINPEEHPLVGHGVLAGQVAQRGGAAAPHQKYSPAELQFAASQGKLKFNKRGEALIQGKDAAAEWQKGARQQFAGGMAEINKQLSASLHTANDVWAKNTPKWREATTKALHGSVEEIRSGMQEGSIQAQVGQKRINQLLGEIRFTQGGSIGVAKAMAEEFQSTGSITKGGVRKWLQEISALPKGSRESAVEAINGMVKGWATGHPKLEAQFEQLTQAEKKRFGSANRQLESNTKQAMSHVSGSVTEGAQQAGAGMSNIFTNLSSALSAVGADKIPTFRLVAVGKDPNGASLGRQEGGPIPGTFMVPGTGSGDKVPMMLPPGSFIENREAARLPFQEGGLTPVILEPKERVWLPPAVSRIGLGNLHARNRQFPRFQEGGLTLPHPSLTGPQPVGGLGQKAIDKTWKSAQKYLRAHSEPGRILHALHAMEAQASKGYPYVYGGGHGGFHGPFDCSGYVSYGLHAAGFLDTPMSVQQGSGLYTLGAAGPGRWLTWGVRGTSGANAHTMMAIKAPGGKWKYFEAGGSGGGAHELGGWDGNFQFRHMPGFQKGGAIQGLMSGGPAGLKLHGPALFTHEGPGTWRKAMRFHAPWVKPGWKATKLSAAQEGEYQHWRRKSGTEEATREYDMRGFWLHRLKLGNLPTHKLSYYPDGFKTPWDAGWSKWGEGAVSGTPLDWIYESVGEGVLTNLKTGQIILDHRHSPNRNGEYSRFQTGGQVGMPKKAQEAVGKYGQEAFNPRSEHFVGWGYQRGGLIPRFSVGGSVPSKKGILVGASTYGGPADTVSNPTYGAAGPSHPLASQLSFAELAMGKALGGLKFGTPLTISRAGKSIVAYKEDIGLGGGDVAGHNRAIDLWYNAAQALGVVGGGTTAWLGTVRVSSASGTKGQSAKEEKEHTYKEEVPATYHGCSTKTLHFPKIPKNRKGIERELTHWSRQKDRFQAAIKAARKDNRPGVVQDLQHNVADIANHLRELRNANRNLRVEQAKKHFVKLAQKKFSKLTGYETAIEQAQQEYEKRGQFAEQVVDLEPLQPELPSEPEFPEQAKGESDKVYEKKRRDAHNAYEARREESEKAFVESFDAYVGGKEKPAYEAVLGSENDWRTKILEAEQFAAGDWQKQNFLGGFEGRFEDNIVTNVENQETLKLAAATLTEEIKAWKQKVAEWRSDPSNDGKAEPKWIKRLEDEWAAAERKRDTIVHEKLPIARSKEGSLREVLGQARELFYPGKAGGGHRGADKYFELLSNPPVPAVGSGTFEEALRDVQGIHWTDQHEVLKSLPAIRTAGRFGGAIWDTQTAIEELGLKINQANGSIQKASIEGEGTGGEDSSKSELTELEKEELLHYHQRDAIKAALEPVLNQFQATYPTMPPYAGKAHTGAVVPGPPNAEKTMIVKGREGIFTEEQMAALAPVGSGGGEVMVNINGHINQEPGDSRDPIEVLEKSPRAAEWVRRVHRTTQRGVAVGGPGRAWRP